MKIFLNILILNLVCMNSWANAQTGPPKGVKNVEFEVMKVYGLNSEYAEFSPVRFQSEIVFASDRIYDFNSIGEDNWSKTKHINFCELMMGQYLKDNKKTSVTKIIFHTRSKTLEIKVWAPWKFENDLCVACKNEIESMCHFMNCTSYQSEPYSEWSNVNKNY